MQRMKQWIMGCATLAALVAGGCATSNSPVEETTGDGVTVCHPEQGCPLVKPASHRSCYSPAGLCGTCSNTTVYDCVPVVPNPEDPDRG